MLVRFAVALREVSSLPPKLESSLFLAGRNRLLRCTASLFLAGRGRLVLLLLLLRPCPGNGLFVTSLDVVFGLVWQAWSNSRIALGGSTMIL